MTDALIPTVDPTAVSTDAAVEPRRSLQPGCAFLLKRHGVNQKTIIPTVMKVKPMPPSSPGTK